MRITEQDIRNEKAVAAIVKILEAATEPVGWDMETGGKIIRTADEGFMLKARLLREMARQNGEPLPDKEGQCGLLEQR